MNSAPTWSPDGKRIAYGRWNRPFGNTGDLWAVPVRGGTPVRLTHAGKRDYPLDPDWSPDGSRIAFHWVDAIFGKGPSGDPEVSFKHDLRVISAHGSAAPTGIGDGSDPPRWTPDGQFILCGGCFAELIPTPCWPQCPQRARSWSLINPDGSLHAFLDAEKTLVFQWGNWAPRGDRLAVLVPESELWTVHRDGSDPRRVLTGANSNSVPDWGSGPLLTRRLRPPPFERG